MDLRYHEFEHARQLEEERRLAEADAQDTHEHEWVLRDTLTAHTGPWMMKPVYAWWCRICGESGYAV